MRAAVRHTRKKIVLTDKIRPKKESHPELVSAPYGTFTPCFYENACGEVTIKSVKLSAAAP